MTDERCRSIAASFLHVVRTTPSVRGAWVATPKTDRSALCAVIAQSLALEEVPSVDELRSIAIAMDAMLGGTREATASRVRHLAQVGA